MIASLAEYLAAAKAVRLKANAVWYRGIDDRSYSVSPGLYWRQLGPEYSLVTDFITTAPPFMDSMSLPTGDEMTTLWEWYFLMQHYGLPTRLLDWTENPLVALYFAVAKITPTSTGIPSVWALDPTVLNRATVGDDHVIVPGRRFSSYWLPQQAANDSERCSCTNPEKFAYSDGKDYYNRLPLAINPPRRSRRIIAQAGVFTVHGTDRAGLEQILAVSTHAADIAGGMVRMDIDPLAATDLREDLLHLGITELALFPELPNLARHIKQSYAIADVISMPMTGVPISSAIPDAAAGTNPGAPASPHADASRLDPVGSQSHKPNRREGSVSVTKQSQSGAARSVAAQPRRPRKKAARRAAKKPAR